MRIYFQYGLIALAVILSWRRGGKPERLGAAIMVLALLADKAFHVVFRGSVFHQVDLWHFALDTMMLVAFVALALNADRKWPLWAAALQLIATTSHIMRYLQPEMMDVIYPIISRAPFYPQLLIIIAASLMRPRPAAARPTLG